MPVGSGSSLWEPVERGVLPQRSPGVSTSNTWSQLWAGEGFAKQEEREVWEGEGSVKEEESVKEKEGAEGGGEAGNRRARRQNAIQRRRELGSRLPSGKLNGWAKRKDENNDTDDDDDFKRLEYPPSSEDGSDERTCSTQWSEMESQFSWGSMKSYAAEEGSLVGGELF